jgi:hypothetical protein
MLTIHNNNQKQPLNRSNYYLVAKFWDHFDYKLYLRILENKLNNVKQHENTKSITNINF